MARPYKATWWQWLNALIERWGWLSFVLQDQHHIPNRLSYIFWCHFHAPDQLRGPGAWAKQTLIENPQFRLRGKEIICCFLIPLGYRL